MGKQKRQREKPHKKSPIGLLSVKDFDEVEDIAKGEKEKALLDVCDRIQSCNMEEMFSALQALETMAWDISMTKHIIKDGVVKIVAPLLLDSNTVIRAATACALKQIADNSETNMLVNLIKDDIMTPLTALLKQHYSNWIYKSDHKNAKDEKETYVQAVTLLWTLCENSDQAISFVNEQNLVPILIRHLDIHSYDIQIIVVTIQCLIVIAEDNIDAIMVMKSSIGILQNLMTEINLRDDNSMQSELWLIKIASFSLLNNVCTSDDIYKTKYIDIFIKTVDEVLSVDNKQLLSSLVSILPHENNAISTSKIKKVTENKMMLSTQQLTLEILTNLSSGDDENDENADFDDSEEMDTDVVPMDVDNPNENLKSFPIELVEAFNHSNLIDKIWKKTVAVDTDSHEILAQIAEGRSILNQFRTNRCRAYLCLNNLLPNFNIDTLGGVDYLYSKWLELGKIVVEDIKEPDDFELLDAVIFVMRAIIDRFSCIDADVFIQFNEANFQLMLNNELQTRDTNESIRVNMVRLLGALALRLMKSRNQRAYEMVKKISEILLDSCMGETQAWIIAETIDATMDLFAEDKSDSLAFDIQLIQRLKPLVPIFKDKVRQQKNNLTADKMVVVSTVNTNIWRFIKYKEKQIKKFR